MIRIKSLSNGITVRAQSGEDGAWQEVGFVENSDTDYRSDAKAYIDSIKSDVAEYLANEAKQTIDNQ